MAEVSKEAIKKGYELKTIKEFRDSHGVTHQAIDYAIQHNLIDYIDVGPRVRVICMTERTKNYTPNQSPHRSTMQM